MVKLKSKKMHYVIILSVLVIAILLIYLIKSNINNNLNKTNNTTSKTMGIFDTQFDANANYIDFNSSKNFTYDIKIAVNNSKTTDDLVQLTYAIGITPKSKKVVYKNVIATASLDKNMLNYIVSNNLLFFGTDMSKPITIDNKQSTGIDISYSALIEKNYNKNQLIDSLKLPISLKISWKDKVEYVKITPSELNIKFK